LNSLDLGPALVALTTVPSGAGTDSQTAAEIESVKAESDPALSNVARPAYLPDGMTFFGATIVRSPVQLTVTIYLDPNTGKGVTLAQSSIKTAQPPNGSKATIWAPGIDIVEVDVAGAKAAHVVISGDPAWKGSKSSLVWLGGETVYQLSGRGTSDDELIEIAASV
jgi:Domain of unknown function (DUF4367)